MKMIIGGAYQGKLAYAKKQNPYIHWTDGELCEGDNIFEAEGVFHFEKYIQSMIKKENWSEKEAIDFASKLTKKCPDIVIVTQEIGYGLVPVDAFDRRYRELTCQSSQTSVKVWTYWNTSCLRMELEKVCQILPFVQPIQDT